jgi:hypothetical protein
METGSNLAASFKEGYVSESDVLMITFRKNGRIPNTEAEYSIYN